MPFRDYFSDHANNYVRYRPGYPEALFEYLASLAPARELAWDCGTGNGQAAVGLGRYFKRVIATDASREQVHQAIPSENVEYRVEPAEGTTIPAHTVDLITVGVAVHWFDFDPFFQEVRRVARPDALIAVWTYHYPAVSPAVDRVIDRYNKEILAGYWPERIHYLTEHYTTLPFPFEPVTPPAFKMQSRWDLNDLVGFVGSWSATRRYLANNGPDSLEEVWADLEKAWGSPGERRMIRWPLYLRVGRINSI
jgi:SAM-dependent methyltransferase